MVRWTEEFSLLCERAEIWWWHESDFLLAASAGDEGAGGKFARDVNECDLLMVTTGHLTSPACFCKGSIMPLCFCLP